VALATACVLRPPDLQCALPRGLAEALERARKGVAVEPLDVLLAAPRWSDVTGLRLPGTRVAAFAVEETAPPPFTLDVPAIAGIDRLLESLHQDDLVVVDAAVGVLIIDPDGATLAAYQAALTGGEPRRRIFLERQHLVARTLDGREVRVHALAREAQDVAAAVESGADSVAIVAGEPVLPAELEDADQEAALVQLAREAAGKPIVVIGDLSSVAAAAVFAAAEVADVTLVLPLAAGDEGFADAAAYLAEARAEHGGGLDVPLAAWCDFGDASARALETAPLRRITVLCGGAEDLRSRAGAQWLEALGWEARRMGVPLEVSLPDADPGLLGHALALGAAGVLTSPAMVGEMKAAVALLDVDACRAALEKAGG